VRTVQTTHEAVRIPAGAATIEGDLDMPKGASGCVVFAHGSGSSRFSGRNRAVAASLQRAGFATLLLDLLTPSEEDVDETTRHYRFDVDLLGARVVDAADWVMRRPDVGGLPLAFFGASTGAAAALIAAAQRPDAVRTVISRGGRPDLAGAALPRVACPTLLIVGGRDDVVLDLNRAAAAAMRAPIVLEIVARATHLFEEPGALEEVSRLSVAWCRRYLAAQQR
jgi:dienelactone hydrolase